MLILLSLAFAESHPTDTLDVSNSPLPGLYIIVGGDILGPLSGSISDKGTPRTLQFHDNGEQPDLAISDGIFVAHLNLEQKGGEAPLTIQMGESILWEEPIPIGESREQLFLKLLVQNGSPIVKVDTFDEDSPSPETEAPPPPPDDEISTNPDPTKNPPEVSKDDSPKQESPPFIVTKPSAPFYESNVLLQTMSALIFIFLGFFMGDRLRQSKAVPRLRWLYLGHGQFPPTPSQLLLIGQRQCWACDSPTVSIDLIDKLIPELSGAGPILLISSPEHHANIIKNHRGRPGLFISTAVPTSLDELKKQVAQLRRLGNPIVLIDGIDSIEKAQNNEPKDAVLKDILYWLPEGVSILALVSSDYSGIIQHRLSTSDLPQT